MTSDRDNIWKMNILFIIVFFMSVLVSHSVQQNGDWLVSHPEGFHQTKMIDGSESLAEKYDHAIKNWKMSHVTNNEVWYAMQLLFYGKKSGISIELGALSGTMATRCETEELEKFQWQRIVIEANPTYRDELSQLSSAFAVNAAICNSSKTLHYVRNLNDPYVNGIVEFMHPNFMKKFHPTLSRYRINNEPFFAWPSTLPPSLVEIPCISMRTVMSTAGITHVNLWLLDTEGSELSILRTVDWDSVVFDVIIVETEPKNRSSQYALEVKKYLEARDYVLLTLRRGRNSWYRHKTFISATKSPNLDSYMYFLKNVIYSIN